MFRFSQAAILLVTTLILGACASAPIHYHTLVAPPSEAAFPGQRVPFLIEVLPVGVPEQLDRPQLVVRHGDNGVSVLETERWASMLDDEIRQALSAALTQQLGTKDIAGLTGSVRAPVVRVKLQVRRFDAWLGTKVHLSADWSLSVVGKAKEGGLTCGAQFSLSAPGGYVELVQAQQQAISLLAERIAADARKISTLEVVNANEC
ncbi:membrane integrity-associated transporter subunit PqiC [Pollutimonas sp. M17]|uniref:PqiC family protein n=1 Tax=Pollutimonas sp. M17 TaxID=2962065 RepID=UPI0021F4083F|nr:PqiC family protein [Pollutimonas sp. M17]UYO93110.1 PqiC family protein [Pollutimonas sp. M17]